MLWVDVDSVQVFDLSTSAVVMSADARPTSPHTAFLSHPDFWSKTCGVWRLNRSYSAFVSCAHKAQQHQSHAAPFLGSTVMPVHRLRASLDLCTITHTGVDASACQLVRKRQAECTATAALTSTALGLQLCITGKCAAHCNRLSILILISYKKHAVKTKPASTSQLIQNAALS